MIETIKKAIRQEIHQANKRLALAKKLGNYASMAVSDAYASGLDQALAIVDIASGKEKHKTPANSDILEAVASYIKEAKLPVSGEGREYSTETSDCRRNFIAKYMGIFERLLHQ